MKRRSDHRSTNKSTRDATMDEFYGFKQFNQQPPTLSSSSTPHNHNNNHNNNKNTKTRRTNIVGSREYFDEAAKWMEQHEQQQQQHENHRDASSKRISDRETHYQSRWRKRELSPDRIDPFSTTTTTTTSSSSSSSRNKHKTSSSSSSSSNKRSYSEIYQESALDREKADLENQLKRKQMNKQLLSAAKAHATSSTTATATHTHNLTNDDSTSQVTSQHKQRKTSPSLRPQSSTTTTTINHNDDNNNNNTDHTDNNTNVHINYKPSGLLYNYQQQQTSTGSSGGSGGNVEEEEARNNMMTSSWNDPPESRIPTGQKWRLYVMRDGNEIEKPIHLIHQKSFLFGRDRNTVDVPIDHLSCSKLHAVICFRLCSSSSTTTHKKHQKKSREDSEQQSVIKPFLMDMKSTNGTMLNGKRVEDYRFYELRNNDLIQFGHSTREYILIDERLALEEEE